ncbi:hypothetical protein M8J76_016884 [Diaphorina citri]|nr:hypothetical protein M8J75_014785 [Diaphorina citri]KAI5727244.1 hypothetical protein M8J76_016884 [Diaphorina citri]KAI5731647.1 hypothetical protein M8J77_013778 [Diaphorina citri]
MLLVHGYCLGTNGLIWKRNSAQQWQTVVEKKAQNPAVKPSSMDLVAAPATGNVQYQQEEQLANGTVVGKYGILEPNGKLRLVHYTADKDDFRPKQETVARVDFVGEDTLKNVNERDLKLHNRLADFNSIKAAIAPPAENLKAFPSPEDPVYDRGPSSEKILSDVQGYASNYKPYNSGSNYMYHSKYYPDYYQGNTYYTGSGNYYPDSRGYGYGMSVPEYPGYTYNSYGPTLPTKYHHTSQLYPPKVDPPAIPNYYPLYDVPTPRIPTVNSYPCCSG